MDGVYMIEYDWCDDEKDWHTSCIDGIVFESKTNAEHYCKGICTVYKNCRPKFVKFIDS